VVQELKDTILIKLIDFGVSKMSATGDLITPTGTFKYKAPEIET
jgi:serine/threonine protein kinase